MYMALWLAFHIMLGWPQPPATQRSSAWGTKSHIEKASLRLRETVWPKYHIILQVSEKRPCIYLSMHCHTGPVAKDTSVFIKSNQRQQWHKTRLSQWECSRTPISHPLWTMLVAPMWAARLSLHPYPVHPLSSLSLPLFTFFCLSGPSYIRGRPVYSPSYSTDIYWVLTVSTGSVKGSNMAPYC